MLWIELVFNLVVVTCWMNEWMNECHSCWINYIFHEGLIMYWSLTNSPNYCVRRLTFSNIVKRQLINRTFLLKLMYINILLKRSSGVTFAMPCKSVSEWKSWTCYTTIVNVQVCCYPPWRTSSGPSNSQPLPPNQRGLGCTSQSSTE